MIKIKSFNTLKKVLFRKNPLFLLRQPFKLSALMLTLLFNKRLTTPLFGSILPTYRCNSLCDKCAKLKMKNNQKEMTTQEVKRTIDSLKSLGVSVLDFTGGEPLLRRDIVELLSYASSSRCMTHLSTNGYLINKKLAEDILLTGIDSINISVDDSISDSVDERTGVKGSFSLIDNAIDHLINARKRLKRNVRISAVTVIDERNISNIENIIKYIKIKKFDSVTLNLLHRFSDSSDGSNCSLDFTNKIDKLIDQIKGDPFIETSIDYLNISKVFIDKGISPIRCVAGYSHIMVDTYFRVFPCFPWIELNKSYVLWNKDKSLREIFHSQEYQAIVKDASSCKKCCWNAFAEMSMNLNPFGADKQLHK